MRTDAILDKDDWSRLGYVEGDPEGYQRDGIYGV
jgi:hypothetical protein